MNGEQDPTALDPYYDEAMGFARELVTLFKIADESGVDGTVEIRGQIRQQIEQWETESSQLRTWLLIEVLARSVAATYEDFGEWSAAVLRALTEATSDGDA